MQRRFKKKKKKHFSLLNEFETAHFWQVLMFERRRLEAADVQVFAEETSASVT